jgi:hypothetical protein
LLVSAVAASVQTRGTNPDRLRKRASTDVGLRQAFEHAAYSLADSGHGTWRGVNPAQRLTLEFDGLGARLRHPDGGVSFHLTGYGYGDRLRKPAPAKPVVAGSRVEYQRGDLTEWYVNGSQGLEQGSTLARRPETAGAGGPLEIALGVTGGLQPAQEADDGSVLFESSKGVVLRYAGLKALDARGRTLPSRLEARGNEVLLIVEDRDARYPLVVDPTWTQQQELTPPGGAAYVEFGLSVSASGNTAVIGSPTYNAGHGAAYVFTQSGGVWSQQQELTASDGAGGDYFGSSVSLSGNTVVIGAPYKTITQSEQGAAYVFVLSSGTWSQQARLTAPNPAADDFFGHAVSLSGDTALVGANNKGAAYVFVSNAGVWGLQQELTASDGAAGDVFAWSVSLSGDTAMIGAPNTPLNQTAGAAYVYARNGGVWTQQQKLSGSDSVAGDSFGYSLLASGDTAVIGAPGKFSNQGVAYVYGSSGGVWTQSEELFASDGAVLDSFGGAVSLSGNTAVIGAPGHNQDLGAAYVFVANGGVWSQQAELTASDIVAAYPAFGGSVAITVPSVLIGAPYKTGAGGAPYEGAVYAFADALQLVPVTPCRVLDTRNADGPLGGPYVAGGTTRAIPVPSSSCGIPSNAAAYSLNVTVVPRTGVLDYLTVWPTGQSQPGVSTLNSYEGAVLANAAIVPAGTGGSIEAYATNDTDLLIDINGYFVPPTSGSLQFYPLTPCRILDTRNATGTFGGPSLVAWIARSFPIPSSGCDVPSGAGAYAFNVTVVPPGGWTI